MISDLNKILKKIEGVNINSINCDFVLDEIDARYWCCKNNKSPEDEVWLGDKPVTAWRAEISRQQGIPQYTRSRDALKLERPDGWDFCCGDTFCHGYEPKRKDLEVDVSNMPNEELAEFHAIIQAKIWRLENE